MLHKYSHFNPNKYQLDVKIATVRSGFHCKYNINYHLVWIPKYRKLLLRDDVKKTLDIILTKECKKLQLHALALEIMPDHLHLFVGGIQRNNLQLPFCFKGFKIPAKHTTLINNLLTRMLHTNIQTLLTQRNTKRKKLLSKKLYQLIIFIRIIK